MPIINYDEQKAYAKALDIEDVGNVALRAITEQGIEYYTIIKTVDGKASIIRFGPVLADAGILLDNFNVAYQKIDYKEATLLKTITQFINDAKKKITDVDEINELEAFECFPDIAECFNNLV